VRVIKNIFLLLVSAFIVCLCGCDVFPANIYDLLSPPELMGDYYPIEKALKKSVDKAYTLRYPSGGDRRSAIVIYDINGDGEKEALAFYSLNEEEMHVNLICSDGEEWVSADDQTVTAGGVERVDFCDLNADGIEEILIGWEMQTSTEKQIAVYSFTANKLNQRTLQRYTEYLCCDLDSNNEKEIFIQHINTTDSVNRASLYILEDSGVTEVSSCMMDKGVKSIASITEAPLANGQNAIYVDELKSSGAVTEVFMLFKGELVNPLLEETAGENSRTARSASLMCKDINHDGILEIPISEEIPAADSESSSERIYCTRWSAYNGETFVVRQSEIINQNDGYSMILPEKWLGNIAVSVDSKRRSRIFFACDTDKKPIAKLVELYAYDIEEWENTELERNGSKLEEICRTADSVIVGRISATDNAMSITMDELKKMIYLNS